MFFQRLFPVLPLTLNKRHFVFLFAAATAQENVKMSTNQNRVDVMPQSHEKNGLLLYYDPFSFYSQKVVMTLHEKKLSFESRLIKLVKSEQYSSWYLEINPRGEVPVLQDTGKIIPDSARIMDYLEDNFSNGDTPRLIPMNQDATIRQKVTKFRHLLQQMPEGGFTTGAVLNQQFMKNPKTPFFGPVRNALAKAEKNAGKDLRAYAEKNPNAKELLLQKAAAREAKYIELSDEKNYQVLLDKVDQILTEVEAELSTHTNDKESWWLCSDQFTIADVELTIVLVRINQLGMEERYWTGGVRPNIEKYFARVQERDSYKQTVPGTFDLIKSIVLAESKIVIGVVAAIAVIITGAILAKIYL